MSRFRFLTYNVWNPFLSNIPNRYRRRETSTFSTTRSLKVTRYYTCKMMPSNTHIAVQQARFNLRVTACVERQNVHNRACISTRPFVNCLLTTDNLCPPRTVLSTHDSSQSMDHHIDHDYQILSSIILYSLRVILSRFSMRIRKVIHATQDTSANKGMVESGQLKSHLSYLVSHWSNLRSASPEYSKSVCRFSLCLRYIKDPNIT